MKIVYVRDSKNKGYTILGIDSGDGAVAYTVEAALYAQIGTPPPSSEIPKEAFERIAYRDEIFRATKKALSLLSYSDNNCRTLEAKLRRAGFSSTAARECVGEMLSRGYINEVRQIERLVLSEAKFKLTGRGKIIPKLIAKGYKRVEIEGVIDALVERGELDFEEIKRTLVMKKLGREPSNEDVLRLYYKHGFFHGD